MTVEQLPPDAPCSFDRPSSGTSREARKEAVAGIARQAVQHILAKEHGLIEQLQILASWRELSRQIHTKNVPMHPKVSEMVTLLEEELDKLLHKEDHLHEGRQLDGGGGLPQGDQIPKPHEMSAKDEFFAPGEWAKDEIFTCR